MTKAQEKRLAVTRQIADEIAEEANQDPHGFFEITPEQETAYIIARNAEAISRKAN